MFKVGDVVYFKTGRRGTKKRDAEVKWNGHGCGVLLCHVPPFEKEPPPEHLIRLIGSIGFISFDDIGEFFGDEVGKATVAKFELKYYGRTGAPGELAKEPPKILGADGKPLTAVSQIKVGEPPPAVTLCES